MLIFQINNLCGKGSTGKICVELSELCAKYGIDNKIIYYSQKTSYSRAIKLTNKFYIKIQALKSRLFGNYGFNSYFATRSLIRLVKRFNPDLIHIHNIHAHNVNVQRFFTFLKKRRQKVVYTFHDCWPFTGYCPHFLTIGCKKWKNLCFDCPLKQKYSWFFDKSKTNFLRKKDSFSGLDLTIVTPSIWLSSIVKSSFLSKFPLFVINNGIDLSVFKPTESDFRKKHNIEADKYIILGVAFNWCYQKGLDVFIELTKLLSSKYVIVLVGTNSTVDKTLPSSIISIHCTGNQKELAELYTSASLFVNATREDTFPTVNIESLACGTPVLTFNTGGSSEIIDETCGSVVECGDVDGLKKEIVRICENKLFSRELCLKKAQQFDMNDKFQKYVDLYKDLLQSKSVK